MCWAEIRTAEAADGLTRRSLWSSVPRRAAAQTADPGTASLQPLKPGPGLTGSMTQDEQVLRKQVLHIPLIRAPKFREIWLSEVASLRSVGFSWCPDYAWLGPRKWLITTSHHPSGGRAGALGPLSKHLPPRQREGSAAPWLLLPACGPEGEVAGSRYLLNPGRESPGLSGELSYSLNA